MAQTVTLSATPDETAEDAGPSSVKVTARLSEARTVSSTISLSLGGSAAASDYRATALPSILIAAGATESTEATGFPASSSPSQRDRHRHVRTWNVRPSLPLHPATRPCGACRRRRSRAPSRCGCGPVANPAAAPWGLLAWKGAQARVGPASPFWREAPVPGAAPAPVVRPISEVLATPDRRHTGPVAHASMGVSIGNCERTWT